MDRVRLRGPWRLPADTCSAPRASPTLYITGDTIWYDQVAETIKQYSPQVIVANAGAAQFLHGDPITMTAGDIIRVCRAAPHAQVAAVHMEAINHCLLTRKEL